MSRDIQWPDSADSFAGVSIHHVDEELGLSDVNYSGRSASITLAGR